MWQMECIVGMLDTNVANKIILKNIYFSFKNSMSAFKLNKKKPHQKI